MRDFTYSEGCGCKVTFFAASDFRTSRMMPGDYCKEHTARDQTEARDELIQKAKDARAYAMKWHEGIERN